MSTRRPISSLFGAVLAAGVAVAVPVTAFAAAKPAKPMITRLSVVSAKPKAKFFVDGRHFVHVRAVKVDGLRALYKVDSPAKLTVTVPMRAKTGRVEVLTRAGSAWSRHALKIV